MPLTGAEIQRRYRARHPERAREQHRASMERYRERQPFRTHDRHLRWRYGIGATDYAVLLERQDGRCALCGTEDPGRNRKYFCVDHDHETHLVRGLLCVNCNLGIGYLGDNVAGIERALRYLHWRP